MPDVKDIEKHYGNIVIDKTNGVSDDEIRKKYNISSRQLWYIKKTANYKEALQQAIKLTNPSPNTMANQVVTNIAVSKAREILEGSTVKAANFLARLVSPRATLPSTTLEIQHKRLQLDAAVEVLNRTGIKAIAEDKTRERAYSPEEIDRALKTMAEIEGAAKRLDLNRTPFLLRGTKTTVHEKLELAERSVTDGNTQTITASTT